MTTNPFDGRYEEGATEYERYLKTAELLGLQKSAEHRSHPDELLFQIIHQVEKVMVDDVPYIPVTEGVDWFQYDTTHVSGWPTASNPYAQPSPYASPDNAVVLTHLSYTG